MSKISSSPEKTQFGQALASLNRIAQTLVAIQNLPETLTQIAESAREVLSADIVDLYEYNQAINEFVLPPVLCGVRRDPNVPKYKIHADDVVIAVVKVGQPKYFPNAQNTSSLIGEFVERADAPKQRFVLREGVVSSVSLPLMAGQETVGVMFVNYRTPQAFDEEQKHLIESFSHLAAIAIWNARLFKSEHDRRELYETLQETARVVNESLSPKEVSERALEQLGRVIESSSASVQLFQGNHRELLSVRTSRQVPDTPQLHRDITADPLINEIVRKRQICVLGDVNAEPLWESLPQTEHIQSWIGAPLIAKGEVIGLLTVDHGQAGYYTPERGTVVAAFAGQLAVALHNSIQAQALARLSQLSERLVSLSEEHADFHKLLQEIAESAKEVLRADIIELYEYSDAKKTYELPQISVGERRHKFVPKDRIYEDDVVMELIHRTEPSYVVNAQGDPTITRDYTVERDDKPKGGRFAVREGLQSTAAIPLKSGDEPVGLMFANYRTPQAFTSEQKELIELFANQAAIAIQNARHYSQLKRKINDLDVLGEIGQQLTANIHLQEQEILELVHQQAGRLMNADNMYIALYDEKTGAINFGLAFEGGKSRTIADRKFDVNRRGRTEEIIYTKESIFIPTRAESEAWYRESGRAEYIGKAWASWVGVPMMVEEKVIGVITTYHPTQDNVYSEEDLNILQTIANQAAIAIQNARLFANQAAIAIQIKDANRRLEILISFGQTLTSGIRLKEAEILNLIHHQASELMDTQNMYVALYDEKTDMIRFGLAFQDGKSKFIESRKIDDTQRGRTEEIIRTKKPIFLPTAEESEDWYKEPGRQKFVSPALPSWIGVPMISEDKVLGVIATYHPNQENVYDENDLKILEGIAGQAAIAIDNARLYSELLVKKSELEKLNSEMDEELQASRRKISRAEQEIVINTFTMDILHRVPNLVGTIPLRADTIVRKLQQATHNKRKGFKENIASAIKQAEGIKNDVENLLVSVKTWSPIDEALKQIPEDVGLLLNSALRNTLTPDDVEVETNFEKDMPCVLCNPQALFESFRCIIENGFQAMPTGGKLVIKASSVMEDGHPLLKVTISDNGHGIQPENLSKVFDLGFTTKKSGWGYGLWRAQAVIQSIGGTIDVNSVVGKGTTFSITLPGQEGDVCHD